MRTWVAEPQNPSALFAPEQVDPELLLDAPEICPSTAAGTINDAADTPRVRAFTPRTPTTLIVPRCELRARCVV
jgi:hypothetical protein